MKNNIFRQVVNILKSESHVWKQPLMWLATAAIIFVPLLDCLIFTGSVWDPYGHLDELPVAIVNGDAGFAFSGVDYNLGQDLTKRLLEGKSLGFRLYSDESRARKDLEKGAVRGIFVLPPSFSQNALKGSGEDDGKIRLVVSEGQNIFASKVCESAAHSIVESLNALIQQKRWSTVAELAPKIQTSLGDIKNAVSLLKDGAAALNQGAKQAATGSQTLFTGTLELASGSSALAKGAAEIDEGARTLGKGITTLNDSVTANAFSPAPLKKGTKDLSDGSNKLVPGITSLAEGLDRLDKGIGSLSDGARVLAQGNRDLESGTLTLSAGLNLLYEKIPDTISLPIESPQAMALGVQIIEEKTDPQPNNGHGFASYFICINLWIGALLTTFILPFRTLPGSARRSSQTAKVSAKLVTPILIACLQGVSMVWGMSLFGVHFANPAAAFGAAVLMSCAFVFVIYALIAIAADAGRLLCLILTIVQAACAGGSFPLELAGPFYQVSHEIVPMRFGLDGIRFAISGALGSQFGANMLKLGLTIVICAVLMSIGRFKWIYSEGETIESIISI